MLAARSNTCQRCPVHILFIGSCLSTMPATKRSVMKRPSLMKRPATKRPAMKRPSSASTASASTPAVQRCSSAARKRPASTASTSAVIKLPAGASRNPTKKPASRSPAFLRAAAKRRLRRSYSPIEVDAILANEPADDPAPVANDDCLDSGSEQSDASTLILPGNWWQHARVTEDGEL